MQILTINRNDAGQRLDKFLSKAVKGLPTSMMYKYIRLKKIKVNRARTEPSYQLAEGDEIQLFIRDEFFSAPRIDNLMCAWGTLQGYLAAKARPGSLDVWFSADNEETGSETRQGAGSAFLRDTLERVCKTTGNDLVPLLSSGFMVSADNGHARHPNHPELCDPLNTPHVGGGVVIKSNAAQHYTTDGLSEAVFRAICEKAGVPVQLFANRSDLRGGSTLGSISNTKVPIRSVDVGMAQLSMHSAYETAGTADTAYLVSAMKQFFESNVQSGSDRSVRLSFD